MKTSKIEDDNFTKGLKLIKNISFVDRPSLDDFRDAIVKLVGKKTIREVKASYVTSPQATAIYKALAVVDNDHDMLYLLFPRQDERTFKTVFAIGCKVVNRWEDEWDTKFAPKTYGEFKNTLFEALLRKEGT